MNADLWLDSSYSQSWLPQLEFEKESETFIISGE